MPNRWIAECPPCRWAEGHVEQDDALEAAQRHMLDNHRDLFLMPSQLRAKAQLEQGIGHVQFRDTDASSGYTPVPAQPEVPQVELVPTPAELPPAVPVDLVPPAVSVPDATGDSTPPSEVPTPGEEE